MTVSRSSNAGLISGGQTEPDGLRDAGIQDIKEMTMIAIPEILQVEVYVNEAGNVIISQPESLRSDPQYIHVNPSFVGQLCGALRLAAMEALEEAEGEDE